MFFDNRCLKVHGSVDAKRCIFRLSRMVNKTVQYHVGRLNCDHHRDVTVLKIEPACKEEDDVVPQTMWPEVLSPQKLFFQTDVTLLRQETR